MWHLTTRSYRYFDINEKGYIKSENWNFSGQWQMLGLQHVKRNEFIPFEKLAELLPTLTLQYKNGNPQYTVVDLDHGTRRHWGDGVISLCWSKEC